MVTKEFPEEDEVLFGTVDRIVGTSVFVRLDNYGKEGVINFSEVAPGRIRNIRDYVRQGQKIVCKVLRVDKVKGHIDLSLRRVTSKEKKEITQEYKREKEFSVVLNLVVKDKARVGKIADGLRQKIKFSELLHKIIHSPEEAEGFLREEKLNEDEIKQLEELVSEKLREKKIVARAKITLMSEAADGIERIKRALAEAENKGAEVIYMGAPNYVINIESDNHKEANRRLHALLDEMILKAKENNYKVEVKEK